MTETAFTEIDESLAPATVAEPMDITEIRDGKAVVQLSRTEAGLAQLRSDLAGKTWDLKTTKGDKEARAARLRCVTLRTDLEKMRKARKAPALEYGRELDVEAKRITDAILQVEAPIDAQIVADERRRADEKAEAERIERERVAKLQAGVAGIRGYIERAAGLPAERIAKGVELLEGMAFDERWQEFQAEAERARVETLAKMKELHAQAVAAEAQAVENERLRQLAAQQEAELAQLRAAEAERQAAHDRLLAEAMKAAEPPVVESDSTAALVPVQIVRRADGFYAVPADHIPPASMADEPQPQTEAEIAAANGPEVDLPPELPPPTLKLGAICTRLGFQINMAFLQSLGVEPAGRDKAAVLYRESQWADIKAALIRHIEAI